MVLFPMDYGRDLGIDIEQGRAEETRCSNGNPMKIFLHRMRVAFGGGQVDLNVGFGDGVFFPVIGRSGFFERFRVSFDHSFSPPGFEITALPPESGRRSSAGPGPRRRLVIPAHFVSMKERTRQSSSLICCWDLADRPARLFGLVCRLGETPQVQLFGRPFPTFRRSLD